MKIAGLDIGTTGCKCTVFDEEGNYLGRAYHEYSSRSGKNGLTIDASDIVDGVFDVIRAMAAQYPDIGGIGVTSFGETFVAADDRGEPLYPSMLYTDPRGEQECAELTARIGENSIAQITGLRPHQMYSISKALWLKHNKPEIWKKVRHIFLIGDYVIYRLTGERVIDYSLATRTMAFDIRRLEWSRTIFEAAGVDSSLFSKPVPTGSVAGVLTREAADKTGLSCDTEVILSNPLHIVLIAVPLTIQTFLIFFIAYGACKLLKLPHDIAAPAGLIGASNFFELAVAVAIALFGTTSPAALATTVGVLTEVPVMLMLVRIANKTKARFE